MNLEEIEFEGNGPLSDILNKELPSVGLNFPKTDEESSNIEPKTIFVWIDILGFSSLVENEKKYSELLQLLKRFYNAFKQLNESADCQRISDGIILKLKPALRKCSVVKKFFNDIMKVQNFFLQRNKFLRGGIAVGSKFNVNDIKDTNKRNYENFYISNGLARAYNLESKSITWPIIGTNDDYLNEICSIYGEDVQEIFEETYSEKGLKVYYLNSYKLLNETERNVVYKNVLSNISENDKKPHVQQKYIWIQNTMENIDRNLISLRCPKCGESVHV